MAEATYYTSAPASVAGASKRHLAVFNAAGSGKVIKIYHVLASGAPTAAVVGLVIPLTVTRITAAPTGGTAGVIAKADAADAAVPAQVTSVLAATGGATEEGAFFGCATVSGEETAPGATVVLYHAAIDGTKPIICPAGTGVLVKQGALASAGAINAVVVFTLV